jgi:fimbrial chaperone protein
MGSAASFQVNPIRVDLSAAEPTAALTVTNNGAESVVVQVQASAWSQENDQDHYTPTSDILATPPIATISAGTRQILRVGLRKPSDVQRELAYRIFIQEVPPAPKPSFRGLQVALRIGVPVFVAPQQGPAKPHVTWSAAPAPNGTIRLTAINNGNAHIRIDGIKLFAAGDTHPIASQSLLSYVLPGHSHDWILKPSGRALATHQMRLEAHTDAGDVNTTVDFNPR